MSTREIEASFPRAASTVPRPELARDRLDVPERPSPPLAPADCRGCGVCCFSHAPDYVRVTGRDWTRLGDAAERVAHFIGHRAFMRMSEGRCAALAVQTGADGAPDFFCTIYERRPQTCRDLGRGTPQCLGELATKRERVAATVAVACSRAAAG